VDEPSVAAPAVSPPEGEASMLALWAPVAIFAVIAVGFSLTPMVISRILRPRHPNPIKLSTYECGMETIGTSWIQYYVSFYVYALVFVVFDVETVFLYPWAVAYGRLGLFALGEMIVFIAILAVALVYAWKKQALRWW
jgi:NADH-quinone oxidoreductase subunit A